VPLTILYRPEGEPEVQVQLILAEIRLLADKQKKLGVYNFLHFFIDNLETKDGPAITPGRFFRNLYEAIRRVPQPIYKDAEEFGFGSVLAHLIERRVISRQYAALVLAAGVEYRKNLPFIH